MDKKHLWVRDGEGRYQFTAPVEDQAILELAQDILYQKMRNEGIQFEEPQTVIAFLCNKIGQEENEVFCCLWLDAMHRLIAYEKLFQGTVDGASVHPRVVAKSALHHNAVALIVAHNHPSGNCKPSSADRSLTRKLQSTMDLIDVRFLDHILVCGGEGISFSEKGWL